MCRSYLSSSILSILRWISLHSSWTQMLNKCILLFHGCANNDSGHTCSSCMVLGMHTGGQVSAMYVLFCTSRSLSSSSRSPLAMDSIKLWQEKGHVTSSYDSPHSWISHNCLTFRWCLRLEVIFFLKDFSQHQVYITVQTRYVYTDFYSSWLILVDWPCYDTDQKAGIDYSVFVLVFTKHMYQSLIGWKPIIHMLPAPTQPDDWSSPLFSFTVWA